MIVFAFMVQSLNILAGSVEFHQDSGVVDLKNDEEKTVDITFSSGDEEKKLSASRIKIFLEDLSSLKEVKALNNVSLSYKDLRLKGDVCTYAPDKNDKKDLKGGVVFCKGNVVLENVKTKESLSGHIGTFDLKANKYSIKSGNKEKVRGNFKSKGLCASDTINLVAKK